MVITFKYKKVRVIAGIIATVFIVVLPSQIYLTGSRAPIFPALELPVTYYFLSNNSTRTLWIYLAGILIDALYNIPIGTSSFAFILSNFLINNFSRKISLREYHINVLLFIPFVILIIFIRYFMVWVVHSVPSQWLETFFYTLTTICSYPIVYSFLKLFRL